MLLEIKPYRVIFIFRALCSLSECFRRNDNMKNNLNLLIITDSFIPLCNSAAVQIRDLSQEMVRQGHFVTVLVPDERVTETHVVDNYHGVRVIRLRARDIRSGGYLKRTLFEAAMPFLMLSAIRACPLKNESVDAVIWYSPSIFFGLLVHYLKVRKNCKSYLILRDIFPQWALDVGLIGKGLPYWFFKLFESYQYWVADVVGVQTPGNLVYMGRWSDGKNRKIEVLQNWLADSPDVGCNIRIQNTVLAGRKIFVYAGNMGVAQGMPILLDLAEKLIGRNDIGFVFVGRGSAVNDLRMDARNRKLENVLFFDAVDPNEIPGLYSQCHIGLIALDPRHKTHNIPGKFLSYMFAGLPVLAVVNSDNDLVAIIENERVGVVYTGGSVADLMPLAVKLVEDVACEENCGDRCKQLAQKLFSTSAAVSRIVASISG